MMVLMTAAVPSWRYVMQNDREEELLYRGGEIADAIVRFQKKNGNAYPTSLDQLVKGKFLRKLYKDPMTKDGKWRLVHQGQAIAPITPPEGSGGSRRGITTTTTKRRPRRPSRGRPKAARAARGASGPSSVWPARARRRACASSTAGPATTNGSSRPASPGWWGGPRLSARVLGRSRGLEEEEPLRLRRLWPR